MIWAALFVAMLVVAIYENGGQPRGSRYPDSPVLQHAPAADSGYIPQQAPAADGGYILQQAPAADGGYIPQQAPAADGYIPQEDRMRQGPAARG